jgi:hypothetical protein
MKVISVTPLPIVTVTVPAELLLLTIRSCGATAMPETMY